MKATEVRAMSVEQLNEKLTSLKKDLFFLRMQHATNQLDNPLKIAETVAFIGSFSHLAAHIGQTEKVIFVHCEKAAVPQGSHCMAHAGF